MRRGHKMFRLGRRCGWAWIACFCLLAGCHAGKGPIRLSGTLEFTEHSVGARVAGRVVTLNVDEGSEVKKEGLIATLDRYEQTKRDYERTLRLFEQGGATRQAVELAQLAMEDQQVVSPIDGVVITKVHESGEVVAAGSAVVTIGDRSDIWVRVFVPESMVNRVKIGQAATISLDGVAQTFQGRVTFVAPRAEFTPRNVQTPEERITQTFAVKVRIEKPGDYLRPGVAADVVFENGGS